MKAFSFANANSIGLRSRTIRSRSESSRPTRSMAASDLRLFVHHQGIEYDRITRLQRGHEHLFDIGEEAGVIDRAMKTAVAPSPSTRKPATMVWVCQWPQGV